MINTVTRANLTVDRRLADLMEKDVLAPLGRGADAFWTDFAELLKRFVPRNRQLLEKREILQRQIDKWHEQRRGQDHDAAAYRAFLEEIEYLVPEPGEFTIGTQNVDPEIAKMAGPQLVVPILNARFLLNAANARWGSLYDAFYGTDALDAPPARPGGYDEKRGAAVVARVREFLNETIPGWDRNWDKPADNIVRAYRGDPANPEALLFENNGLHIEVQIDRDHPIGKTDPLGIKDVLLESALTTIADCEDSVAAVDAEDKLLAYTNWLGLIRGDLSESFEKGGKTVTRDLAPDREYTEGSISTLPGRSLMFVRNVGHLMTNPAIQLADGSEIPEGIMDAVFTSAISTLDIEGHAKYGNSQAGSIYIVKPKMHGPEECAFTDDLFDAVEDLLGLERHTIKVGVMDE
ncbi:MAG: malate synthase G, partial [Pontixanthobacter sp.]